MIQNDKVSGLQVTRNGFAMMDEQSNQIFLEVQYFIKWQRQLNVFDKIAVRTDLKVVQN